MQGAKTEVGCGRISVGMKRGMKYNNPSLCFIAFVLPLLFLVQCTKYVAARSCAENESIVTSNWSIVAYSSAQERETSDKRGRGGHHKSSRTKPSIANKYYNYQLIERCSRNWDEGREGIINR